MGLKAANNIPLTVEEKAMQNMQKDMMVTCNYCGRKFNETAGNRHIAFCQSKAKQIPKFNTSKKK